MPSYNWKIGSLLSLNYLAKIENGEMVLIPENC